MIRRPVYTFRNQARTAPGDQEAERNIPRRHSVQALHANLDAAAWPALDVGESTERSENVRHEILPCGSSPQPDWRAARDR